MSTERGSTVVVSVENRRRLRMLAAATLLSMQEHVDRALREYLDRQEKGQPQERGGG